MFSLPKAVVGRARSPDPGLSPEAVPGLCRAVPGLCRAVPGLCRAVPGLCRAVPGLPDDGRCLLAVIGLPP